MRVASSEGVSTHLEGAIPLVVAASSAVIARPNPRQTLRGTLGLDEEQKVGETNGMAELIPVPTMIEAAGAPPKTISEFVGAVATGTREVSIALMESPAGWSEPGQRPEFDEYSLVIEGEILAESESGSITASAGQAIRSLAGEWVRYSTPASGGARYVSVCVPAFSPTLVHRDDETEGG